MRRTQAAGTGSGRAPGRAPERGAGPLPAPPAARLPLAREAAVAVGCTLILTLGIGSVSILNGVSSLLVEGMGADLVSYSLGPSIKSACGFAFSLAAAGAMSRLSPRACLLVGTLAMTVSMLLYAGAEDVGAWYVGSVVNGLVLAFGSMAAVTGVLHERVGERAPVVLGRCYGAMSLLLSALVFAESRLLQVMGYRQILLGYALVVLVVGLLSNAVLIGRAPQGPATGAAGGEGGEGEADGLAAPAASAGAGGESGAADIGASGGRRAGRLSRGAEGSGLGALLREPAFYLFCLTMLLAALPMNGFSAFCQNYLVSTGMAPDAAAGAFSVFILAAAVVSFFSGKMSRALGPAGFSAATFGGFAVGVAALLACGGSVPGTQLALAACALVGPSSILPSLLIPSLFGTRAYASASAVGMGCYYLGASFSYYLAAVVIQGAGFAAGFLSLAAAGLAIAGLVALCVRLTRGQGEGLSGEGGA